MAKSHSVRDFISTIFTRIKDLCVKLVSVKGLFVIMMTARYFDECTRESAWMCGLSWVLFIGGREAEKLFGYMKVPIFGKEKGDEQCDHPENHI